MLISYNWLKKFVNLPDSLPPEEVALKLKNSTVEVEGITRLGENFENIVVGKVVSLEKHPNADKLKVCQVSVGNDNLQIVCGGSNVRESMLVALAKVGSKVRWHGEGELVELKPAAIRGVESFGMICASTEIGLGDRFPLKDEKEILDLTDLKLKVGVLLSEALSLNDSILEIENKTLSNRPDLWGHYGIAREVAALYKKDLKKLDIKKFKDGKGVDLKIKIEDKDNCYRYIGVVVGGIKVGSSPAWLQEKLKVCGIRPINNIVDITNYVTLELGRPSHAFDRRDIKNDTIIVRRAKPEEKFTTLDGVERNITEEMCLVCDAERPVDLAGVMGGLNSEIKDDTTEIILELANFNPANIRRTASILGLRTEAAIRFEKGLPPYLAELGLWRLLTLIKEIIPNAHLISKVIDVDNKPEHPRVIDFSLELLNKKIGINLDKKEVIGILERLGFKIKTTKKDEPLKVTVPDWRPAKDISIPEDLMEEVIRIYGYSNIPASLPFFSIVPPLKNNLRNLEREIKNILTLEFAFDEVYNYSFVGRDILEKMGEDLSKYLELANPLAKDRPFLRRYLLPNLLLNLESNLHRFETVKLFEIGKVFHSDVSGQRTRVNSDELLPQQDSYLSLVYGSKGDETPFYTVKEALVGVLSRLGVEVELKAGEHNHLFHNGRFAKVYYAGKEIGLVSEINPEVQKKLGLDVRVAVAELYLNKLVELLQGEKKYLPLPEYPEVVRDLAFVVDNKVEHDQIVLAFKKVDNLILETELFDIYQGKNLPQGKKSLAYHIIYRSADRTLTAEEVDKIQEKIIKVVEEKFKGEIRK